MEGRSKLSPEGYWVRLGMRVEGPYSITQLRTRARSGALSRIALLSKDKSKWILAARVPAVFNKDGSVNASSVVADPIALEADFELPDSGVGEGGPLFIVALPGGACVRAEWVLVPAWLVVMVGAMLPVARAPGDALLAWDFPLLASGFGWRGVLSGSAWVAVLASAVAALVFALCFPGRRRAVAGLTAAAVLVAAVVVAYSSGSARAMVSSLCLVTAVCAAACIVAVVQSRAPTSASGDRSSIPMAAATTCALVGIASILVMVVAVVVKGAWFIIPGAFTLIAGGSLAIAGVVAGSETPNRVGALWLSIIALAAACAAVLAEGIVTSALGGPRLATFDSIRAITEVSMAAICAYLGLRELRSPAQTAPTLAFEDTEPPEFSDDPNEHDEDP